MQHQMTDFVCYGKALPVWMMQGIYADDGLSLIDEKHSGKFVIKRIVSNGGSNTPCNSLDGNRRSTYSHAVQQLLRFLAGGLYAVARH